MTTEFWLNLASKNLLASKDFFVSIGFELNELHSSGHMVSLFVGNQKTVLNLFSESTLEGFMGQKVTDKKLSNEIIFSIGVDSPTEVDALANKAVAAGAKLFAKPDFKDGWMYGCGFVDLDGHRWNILYMDLSKVPT